MSSTSKPPPPRKMKKEEIKMREREIWLMRTEKFMTQTQIGKELNISNSFVSAILTRITKRFNDEFRDKVLDYKYTQTEQLTNVAREAADAWEKSKQAAKSVTTKEEDGGKTGKGSTIKSIKEQYGDPRFLNTIITALADVREIWGLNAPAAEATIGTAFGSVLTEDDRLTRLLIILKDAESKKEETAKQIVDNEDITFLEDEILVEND